MRIGEIDRTLNAIHAWLFIPVPLGTPQELLHSVEHRIFLDPRIAALEDAVIRHNGMTCWSGIRLEFTLHPSRVGELIAVLGKVFSEKLPKMSFFERERFARELEEGGGHVLDRALDRFRSEFFRQNDVLVEVSDEEDVWSRMEFGSARMLLVGPIPHAHDGMSGSDLRPRSLEWGNDTFIESWRSEPMNDANVLGGTKTWKFPVFKEELPELPDMASSESGTPFDPEGDFDSEESFGAEEPYDGFDVPDGPIEYAIVFPSMARTAREYAFHVLFF